MTRTAVALAAVLAAPGGAQAQSWGEKLFTQAGTSLAHDFGTVPRGAVLSHRFVMRNPYAKPMTVLAVRTSCGCVNVTGQGLVIPPLQTGALELTMDARRFVGAKTVQVFVTVGQPPDYNSTATLTVSANSRQDVVFNPGAVNFGVVPQGQTPSQTLDVEYAGAFDWRVQQVKTDAPLTVEHKESYRRPGGVGYKLAVTLRPDAPAGQHHWEVTLVTNDPATPTVTALVEANVQAPLAAVPDRVTLTGPVGREISRRVFINGTQPFRVVRVDGQGDGLSAEVLPNAQPVHIVTIRFTPAKAGAVKRQLVFHTDLQQPPAVVAVEAGGE